MTRVHSLSAFKLSVLRDRGGGRSPDQTGSGFSRPASLMTPFCAPRPGSLQNLNRPPICWTSAAGLTLSLVGPARSDHHGHSSVPSFSRSWWALRGPGAGPGPCRRTPWDQVKTSIITCAGRTGAEEGGWGVGVSREVLAFFCLRRN